MYSMNETTFEKVKEKVVGTDKEAYFSNCILKTKTKFHLTDKRFEKNIYKPKQNKY